MNPEKFFLKLKHKNPHHIVNGREHHFAFSSAYSSKRNPYRAHIHFYVTVISFLVVTKD